MSACVSVVNSYWGSSLNSPIICPNSKLLLINELHLILVLGFYEFLHEINYARIDGEEEQKRISVVVFLPATPYGPVRNNKIVLTSFIKAVSILNKQQGQEVVSIFHVISVPNGRGLQNQGFI